MPWKDNARAWYDYAIRTGDDSVARFMMHWIAFNFMYSECCARRDGRRYSEREQIERLCEAKRDDLIQCEVFDDPEAIKKFLEYPVLKGRRRPHRSIEPQMPADRRKHPHDMDPYELWGVVCRGGGFLRIQCILLTLYQVRCNLFHGSKDPDYPRDRELIREAAILMQGCMEALLHIDLSSNEPVV